MSGCATNWISNAIFFLTQRNHQPHATISECSYMASFFEMGKVVFAIPGGIIAQNLPRKHALLGVGFLNFASWITLSFSKSLPIIYIVRFV